MTGEITRSRIVDELGTVSYDHFLFYLIGLYKSFNLNYVLDERERREIDTDDLPSSLRRLFQISTVETYGPCRI